MSNYTQETLVTFMSAYDYGEPASTEWHASMREGAADFIEAYGLVPSEAKIRLLVNDYIKETDQS